LRAIGSLPGVVPLATVGAVDEEAALGSLYSRYSRSVLRLARRLLRDDEAAKDAMQEVFLRVLRVEDMDRFSPNPMAWLYRTTTNLCLNRLRDMRRRGQLLAMWTVNEERVDADADARLLIQRILAVVPDELQDIAVYYYVDELSHEEIAGIVGVSRRTIGNRLATFHALVKGLDTPEVAS
jgi:RNA polymerase sigma factor (sigma-70 family)